MGEIKEMVMALFTSREKIKSFVELETSNVVGGSVK